MKKLLGNEYGQFLNSFNTISPTSVRTNPFKANNQFDGEEKIPWCSYGKYLEARPEFVFDPLFHSGAYYVQEASSMLIAHAIDFSKDKKILDLCAAPGGKSTLLASMMTNESLLVSNETIKSRLKPLEENIIKWGNPNVLVTNNDSSAFSVLENYFDVILVDAPCSGEGMFRKDKEAVKQWFEKHILHCAERQRRILQNVIHSLKPNGVLIYSTCTFSLEENEKVIEWFLENYSEQFELLKINFPQEWNISNGHSPDEKISNHTYRCYPHKIKGEGLFLACLQKKDFQKNEGTSFFPFKKEKQIQKPNKQLMEELQNYLQDIFTLEIYLEDERIFAVPKNLFSEILFLKQFLNVKNGGVFVGEMKGSDFIPSHDLAMSVLLNENISRIELSKENALKYLKKETLLLEAKNKNGWTIVTYKNIPLGWIKVFEWKSKNYFPIEWRIRKDLN